VTEENRRNDDVVVIGGKDDGLPGSRVRNSHARVAGTFLVALLVVVMDFRNNVFIVSWCMMCCSFGILEVLWHCR
jgi:hypothetical protein